MNTFIGHESSQIDAHEGVGHRQHVYSYCGMFMIHT